MKRPAFTLFAATALAGGLGLVAFSQDSMQQDCPEDMDNEAGCGIDDAPVSDRQPVPGATTAPVPPEIEQGQSKTLADPNAADLPERTGTGASDMAGASDQAGAEEDCPEDDDTASGCGNTAPTSDRQPVAGTATAPVPPEMDAATKTMQEPDAEPGTLDDET